MDFITQKEKKLFKGFLWKLNSEGIIPFYFPPQKGIQIFLNAKKKFPEDLKLFNKQARTGQCIALQELIIDSMFSGNITSKKNLTGANYNIWDSFNPNFTISSKLIINPEQKKNYLENKKVIDYLTELYKKDIENGSRVS